MYKKKSRFTSAFLVLLLSIALMPLGVFADDGDPWVCPPHKLLKVEKRPATCVADGTKEYYKCSECGSLFWDEEATKPAAPEDVVIPADGKSHTWDGGTVTVKPTASKNGTKTFKCVNGCGATRNQSIPYTAKSVTLDKKKLQFKKVIAVPVPSYMSKSKIDHVWLTAAKTSMKVSWNDAKNMDYVHGVIVLRKTGKEKVYKEVGRVNFVNANGSKTIRRFYADKTAKKKNTPYTYIAVAFYVKDGYTYISHVSDWAGGQTTASKLKTVYKAKINKKSVKLQYGGSAKLSLKYAKPKTTYNNKSFRWYSGNKAVATVSKGKVTAKKPGTTTIRGRLSSGKDMICKVTVVGAFKPKAPTLKVDVADTSSITLVWSKSKYAKDYLLHQSNDGLHWTKTYVVKGTSKKVTGLTKGHRYTFYVEARNTNGPYTAISDNSNVVNQKAVEKLRPTKVTGWPSTKSAKAGTTIKLSLKVTAPEGRKAYLQMKSGKKWVTKKTVTLPKGTGTSKITLVFPNDWWNGKSYWRLVIPKNHTASAYTTATLTVTATRRYQNPSPYVQIKNSISKHGYSHYVSPVLVDSASTYEDHVNALINTANKYKGAAYVQGRSGAPSKGIDESGLVIQSCYGAGVDLWPISPSTRAYNCVPSIRDSALKTIKYVPAAEGSSNYTTMTKGDLVFFAEKGSSTPTVVAIYAGLGKIVFADKVKRSVVSSTIRTLEDQTGKYKYHVVAVRRIFNW